MSVVKYSVDRIEGDIVVLVGDDDCSHPVSASNLPVDVCCGDVLILQDGAYVHDREETQSRRSYVQSLQEKLRRKNS